MSRFLILFLFLICFYKNVLTLEKCQTINDKLWTKELDVEFDNWEDLNQYFFAYNDNCNLYSKVYKSCELRENIKIKDGYAFMTGKFEKRGIYNFTGSAIKTRNSYSYGRYEFRARLARGDYLESLIMMSSESNTVTILDYYQRHLLDRKIFFGSGSQITYLQSSLKFDAPAHSSIQLGTEFHLYGIEWEHSRLRFFFDEDYTPWQEFSSKQNITEMNRISIQFKIIDRLPSDFSSLNWICPAFILDYVRIYKSVEDPAQCKNTTDIENNRKKFKEENKIDYQCLKYSKVYESYDIKKFEQPDEKNFPSCPQNESKFLVIA